MAIQLKEIKWYKLIMRLNHPFTTSFGTVHDKELYIIEVTDEHGYRGYGETVAFSTPWYTEETVLTNIHIIEDFLIPILKRNRIINHPSEVEKLFQSIRGNHMAKAAIESAIWDLYAKNKGLPLTHVLGGNRKKIDVGISLGIQPTINQLLSLIQKYVDAGYKRIKLKVSKDNDLHMLEKVRQAFPELPLMVDANSAYNINDIDHLKQFDQFNLLMIEQPFHHNDFMDHAKLQDAVETPICLDESIHSFEDVRVAIELGSCQIINIKFSRVGGLSEAIRIHDYCLNHQIQVWCGGMLETGIGRAQNIALASLTNFTLPGDIGESAHYWQQDIISPEVTVENGQIQVPQTPGIGFNIDKVALASYTVDTKHFIL